MRVILKGTAKRDLNGIGRYIALDRPLRAKTFIEELRQKCRNLGDHPHSGADKSDLFDGLRLMPHGNYNIYYMITGEAVVILRILHGARDIDKDAFTS